MLTRNKENNGTPQASDALHCIAIDDDAFSLRVLSQYCNKLPSISLNETYTNPLEALSHFKNNRPDLVFLDINMPEVSGITIARKLKGETMIIFTTSHKDFATEGFELNVIDFLLKPYAFDRFYQAVVKAREHREFQKLKEQVEGKQQEKYIIIKEDYQNVKVRLSDILYIEALDNYVKIHTPQRTYLTLRNLKTMAEHLDHQNFMRVHKSYIVALDKIDYFSRDKIHINGAVVPIGRTFVKKFMDGIRT